MTLYALEAIDDAIDATRAFLWPFDRGRWLRLAFVMFFIGGVGSVNPLQFGGSTPSGGGPETPGTPGTPGAPEALPSIGGAELTVIAAIIGIVALIALAFMLVGSIMEFVFVESLRREAVTIRRYWSDRWGQGLRLFVFRLLLGVLTFGLVGLVFVAALGPVIFGDGGFSLGLVLLAIPIALLVVVLSGLVNGFTTVFVVPIMIGEDRNLLSAWRRFWPTLTGQWKQYAAYAVMGFVLQLVGGILAGIASLIGAIVIAIPLVLVGLIGVGLLMVVELAGWVVIGLAVVLFVLALIVLSLFVSVPVQTYLRYYALFVLGDTNEAFDLIPERRQAVR
jgi:hypothetical protein